MGIGLRGIHARAAYRTYRLFSPLYYYALYGRHLPPSLNAIMRRLQRWEGQWRGDSPVSRDIWDSQYRAGHWRYMAGLPELGRYSLLAGYLRSLKPGGAFLDIGCGEGVLLNQLGTEAYRYYLGIDLSRAAIEQAAPRIDAKTQFVQADAEQYQPACRFDAVIFNECMYYFYDPISTFERYAAALVPGGIVLLSNYLGSTRATRLIQRLRARYAVLDESWTMHDTNTWSCMVIDPSQRR